MQGLYALHWGVRMRACVCMRECKNASFLSLSTPIVMGNSFETGNSNDFPFVAKRCLIKPQRKERKEKRINGKSHLKFYLYNITETVSMRHTIYNTLSAERALLEKTSNGTVLLTQKVAETAIRIVRLSVVLSFVSVLWKAKEECF